MFLVASKADLLFLNWCEKVGIENKKATLATTPVSVAGRGVFATDDMEKGEIAIKIPGHTVLHEFTAAANFPRVHGRVQKAKKRYERRKKLWRRLLPLKGRNYEFTETADLWQAELTQYSIASLESDHFWKPWISQWQRSDPMQVGTYFVRISCWKLSLESFLETK